MRSWLCRRSHCCLLASIVVAVTDVVAGVFLVLVAVVVFVFLVVVADGRRSERHSAPGYRSSLRDCTMASHMQFAVVEPTY